MPQVDDRIRSDYPARSAYLAAGEGVFLSAFSAELRLTLCGAAVDDPRQVPGDHPGEDAWAEPARSQIEAVRHRLAQDPQGASAQLGQLLEGCRNYLLLVAGREMNEAIRRKVAPSDLVQETMTEACQAFGAFAGTTEADLLAWLRRMLVNNLVDAARRYQFAEKRNVQREVGLAHPGLPGPCADEPVDPQPTPMTALLGSEASQAVLTALGRLPESYRQVIHLRNMELLTFPQIGERMNVSAEAARKLWGRGIQRLAAELQALDDSTYGRETAGGALD